jgi:uncharacterized repeat protein (TIGR01451 family)
MLTLLIALGLDDERSLEILDESARIGRRVNSEFPGDKAFVLPTRLGNIIRSFEHYSERQYGIDAIALWPRLISKIDKDYATAIDDAKTSFDFMMNSSVLSAILVLVLLIAGLLYPISLTSLQWWLPWLVEIALFTTLAYVFYLLSISRASAWGDMVKGAFDLYRWNLLEQLGYKHELTGLREERDLWDKISRQMIFGDTPLGPRVNYSPAPPPILLTFAHGKPDTVALETTRGIKPASTDEGINVVLCVKNADTQHTAQNVVVTDTLPDGFDYEWSSAYVDDQSMPVVGSNPYHFNIGNLDPGKEKILTYRAIPRRREKEKH